jgi:HSP20 family protein
MALRTPGFRHPLQDFRREMDRLMTDVLHAASESGWPFPGRNQPAVNMWETAEAVHLELEVPGIQAEQLDISVMGSEVTLRVSRQDASPEGVTYHRRERPVGEFARVVRLPVEVEADRVSAELRNGVLTVTLPKAQAARPRKIQVSS